MIKLFIILKTPEIQKPTNVFFKKKKVQFKNVVKTKKTFYFRNRIYFMNYWIRTITLQLTQYINGASPNNQLSRGSLCYPFILKVELQSRSKI